MAVMQCAAPHQDVALSSSSSSSSDSLSDSTACSFAGQGRRSCEHGGTLILANSKSYFSTAFFLDCLLPMEAL